MPNDVVDLVDAVRNAGSLDEKLRLTIVTLVTNVTASTNAVLAILSALEKTPGVDLVELKKELANTRDMPIHSKDIDQRYYQDLLNFYLTRLP